MNPQDQINELRQRGAHEVKDGSGGGFDQFDEQFSNPALDQYLLENPALAQELDDIEKRSQDAKPSAEVQELTAEQREANLESARRYKFDRQQEVTSYVPGRMLTSRQFLRMLRQINPAFEYNDYVAVGLRGLNLVINGELTYLTSVQDGMMLEWSQLREDDHGVGTNEKYRGWRTVLMNLIQADIVTEEQVHLVFGKPAGPRADRWFRNLYMKRNKICRDCGQPQCVCSQIGETSRADNHSRLWTPEASSLGN